MGLCIVPTLQQDTFLGFLRRIMTALPHLPCPTPLKLAKSIVCRPSNDLGLSEEDNVKVRPILHSILQQQVSKSLSIQGSPEGEGDPKDEGRAGCSSLFLLPSHLSIPPGAYQASTWVLLVLFELKISCVNLRSPFNHNPPSFYHP